MVLAMVLLAAYIFFIMTVPYFNQEMYSARKGLFVVTILPAIALGMAIALLMSKNLYLKFKASYIADRDTPRTTFAFLWAALLVPLLHLTLMFARDLSPGIITYIRWWLVLPLAIGALIWAFKNESFRYNNGVGKTIRGLGLALVLWWSLTGVINLADLLMHRIDLFSI